MSNRSEKLRGPKFVQYFQPVLDALKALGASARPREVYNWILDNHDIPQDEVDATTKGGQSKFENKVGWARFYLVKAGLIASEERGVWVLTDAGREATLSHDQALTLFRGIHDQFQQQPKELEEQQVAEETASDGDISAPDESTYINQNEVQEVLVDVLRKLTAKGFEELCARLLRHIGFENVKVSGGSGDQGVDGEGYLLINRFVRSKVMFQCKRYEGSVGPDKIRDFRGSIQGRAERGIFLTTGVFTRAAAAEAARENATAIELVDIDRLLELLIEEQLGVSETRALKVDFSFFEPYQARTEMHNT